MTNVLEYVDVQITRQIETVSRVGFGSALFIGTSDEGTGSAKQGSVVAEYTNFEAVSDVFAEDDPEYKAAQVYFGQQIRPDRMFIGFKESDQTFVEALELINDVESDWYAVVIDSRDSTEIENMAANIQARDKLFLAASDEAAILDDQDDTDLASTLLDNTYSRTALFYHSDAANIFPEMAWAGLILPQDPGSATWAWKTLSGVTSDTLTGAERNTLESKRATYYVTVAGNNITFEGQTSEPGLFIDIIRGTDWLKYRIAEDVVARLAAVPKIPYVGGGEILEAIIRNRLEIAVDRQLIAEDYTVTVPPASEQQVTDRANRVYKDITFNAQLTGAVHRVEVRGVLTV